VSLALLSFETVYRLKFKIRFYCYIEKTYFTASYFYMIAPLIVVLIKTLRWLETTKMLGSMKCARTLDGC